jgi:hypothetical protein
LVDALSSLLHGRMFCRRCRSTLADTLQHGLGQMLCRRATWVTMADALPLMSLRSPISGKCFAAMSVMAPLLADTLPLRSSQANALPPFLLDSRWILCHHDFITSVGNLSVDVFSFAGLLARVVRRRVLLSFRLFLLWFGCLCKCCIGVLSFLGNLGIT